MNKKILITVLVLATFAGALGYYKFYKQDNVKDDNTNSKSEAQQPTNKVRLPKLSKDLKDLKVTIIKEGNGPEIKKGNIAYVMYVGVLSDGKVFDSNVKSGRPIGFPIGEGAVIKGWDEALIGIKEGTELIIDVPADKAYGKTGIPGRIPANSALRFDIFVVKVMTKEQAQRMQAEAKRTQEKSSKDSATGTTSAK